MITIALLNRFVPWRPKKEVGAVAVVAMRDVESAYVSFAKKER
jgi:hypothetical protein